MATTPTTWPTDVRDRRDHRPTPPDFVGGAMLWVGPAIAFIAALLVMR